MWQRKIPGIAAFLNARTHHIDAVVRHAVTAGTPQVVILGAGYDTRAWRLDTALAGVAVYEVDRPATQARKRSIAARRLGGTPENIRYVEVDFRLQRSAFPALQRAGYEPAKPALFVWEGVSYYLPAADVDALLEDLATRAAPGSAVVFDYLYAEVLTGDCGLHGAEAARQFLQRRGQPYLFGIPRGGLARYLSARGLALVHDLSPEQLWAAYLRGGPGRPEDLFGGYGMALGRATGTTR
jgi:methyltransferase (TIGR00027 family)